MTKGPEFIAERYGEVQTEDLREDERFHLAKQRVDGEVEFVKTAIPLKNALFMFKQYASGSLLLSEKFNAVAIFDEEYRIVAEYRRGIGITYPPPPPAATEENKS